MEKAYGEKTITITTTPVQPFDSVEAREAAQAAAEAQQQNASQDSQRIVEKWWLWEFFAWLVCVAALLGMVGFLAPTNQKPVPKWVIAQNVQGFRLGFSVSINSILSIFSTIVKSSVMIPVAASISQLKWLWFSDGHKLSDFEKFDRAKSGPLGSILLLWKLRGRQLVCLGALITIGSLALDFSFQQLVTYPPHPVPVQTAYMPATATYSAASLSAPSGAAGLQFNIPDARMSTALKIGLDGIDASVDITPDCITGNCTWPYQYTTIGVCSECFDATPKILESCSGDGSYCNYSYTGDYSYDDGLQLSGLLDDTTGQRTIFASRGDIDPSLTLSFQGMTNPLAVLTTIGISQGNQTLINATGTECALFYCVKKYAGSINQTVLHETLVDTYRDDKASYNNDGVFEITAPAEFMKDAGHNGSAVFTVGSNASSAFSWYFFTQGHFYSSITIDPLGHTPAQTDFTNYIWPLNLEGYTVAMSYLAGNMTNAMRMSNRGTSTNINAAGTTWQDQPKVNVVWWWISIPATLVGLSLIFLILTMIESARRGAILWKSSGLAAFYHPLTKDGREEINKASGPKELEEIADRLKVKAENTDRGVRFVQPS